MPLCALDIGSVLLKWIDLLTSSKVKHFYISVIRAGHEIAPSWRKIYVSDHIFMWLQIVQMWQFVVPKHYCSFFVPCNQPLLIPDPLHDVYPISMDFMDCVVELQSDSVPNMDLSICVSCDDFIAILHPFDGENGVFCLCLLAIINILLADSFPGFVDWLFIWKHISWVLWQILINWVAWGFLW